MINIIKMVEQSSVVTTPSKVIRRNKAFTIEIDPSGIFNFYI